jgi:hypothetical protein
VTDPDWNKLRIAEHEAAHAVAAQAMGLRVAWVSIDAVESQYDTYMAATGIEIDGDDDDIMKLATSVEIADEQDLLGVCVSMAMPAFIAIPDGHWLVDYSRMEASQAFAKGARAGISEDEIAQECEVIWEERWGEIAALAQRLVADGRIEFAVAA